MISLSLNDIIVNINVCKQFPNFDKPLVIKNLTYIYWMTYGRTYRNEKILILNINIKINKIYIKKMNIYVLKLEQGKYYVGKTEKDVEERYEEHDEGSGSSWTSMYRPISIIETITNPDAYEEDRQTKIYMTKYGIENVRGGSYTSIKLPEYQKKSLEQEIKTSGDQCYKCGKRGHYAADCNYSNKSPEKKLNHKNKDEQLTCYKCGKIGHYADECYSQYNQTAWPKKNSPKYNQTKCYKCGRPGHYADECYAKNNVIGKKISYGKKEFAFKNSKPKWY